MQVPEELSGFTGDAPVLTSILVCDSVAIGVNQKQSIQGVFDRVNARSYPLSVNGTVAMAFCGVTETFDCRVEACGDYSTNNPLGNRVVVGRLRFEVPPGGTRHGTISGTIALPLSGPGTVDIIVYGNGVYLGSTPLLVVTAGG